jgi:hypothetical protein
MTEHDQRRENERAAWSGRSSTIGKLAAALANVQGEAITVDATETATVKGKTKDGREYSYQYSYATLADVTEAVMPHLGKNALAFVAWTQHTPRGFALVYQLVHESDEWIGGEWTLPDDDPQAIGSEITYARRYCLQALTGVAAKGKVGEAPADDDGRFASERRYRRESFDTAAPRQEQAPPPSPQSIRLGYLKSLVREKGLPEDEVPAAFQAFVGVPIGTANVEQIQAYIDHVQATGFLAAAEPVTVSDEDGDPNFPADVSPPAPERQEPPEQTRQEPPEPERHEPPEQARQEPPEPERQ